jgi:hypothetical protein
MSDGSLRRQIRRLARHHGRAKPLVYRHIPLLDPRDPRLPTPRDEGVPGSSPGVGLPEIAGLLRPPDLAPGALLVPQSTHSQQLTAHVDCP